MELTQGDILWVDLNPAKGTETKKKRPCLIVSNDQYNQYFNTIIVVPISSSEKYRTVKKYVKSPLFMEINKGTVHGTALLQHVRTIDPTKRTNGKVEASLTRQELLLVSSRIQQFY
ncbi:type II toxin-antitoxin system PemK/MazF family toxin [Tetragenococcus halophilus]|uniref:type II toxin-antitoxin system PemK/MazF family toxin n=1 Tax=Tetragenococcus halophilus TaxID=51669 RepID=UPI001F460478|nr:type II toxin-antitoxin system PemK/MazF family toxin [Tetragenococcus halophilus]MCF1684334.1 type II toxin-antitoxin system PemK/MazF family toxin [Tetragenococcus halophilus]